MSTAVLVLDKLQDPCRRTGNHQPHFPQKKKGTEKKNREEKGDVRMTLLLRIYILHEHNKMELTHM